MPTRQELYAEIAARHEREHRTDTRARRWFWVRVLLLCWGWAGIGLFLGGYAFYTTDVEIGHISLMAGELVTLVGVLGTLAWAAIQSETRGWR
jgi:hypothetical protein